jgi:hypothetical protein
MKSSVAIAMGSTLFLLIGISTVVIVLQQRSLQRLEAENVRLRRTPTAASTPGGAFASISPDDVPGTYKWIVNDEPGGTVILHPDRTLTNWRGEKKTYQWQLSEDALLLIWQKDPNVFTRIVAPGVYEGKRDGKVYRIQKEN